MGFKDRNLIFLISQPRSGSTLLQHLIGSHTDVHTLPEPWFLLFLVEGLRPSSKVVADFNATFARLAQRDFLASLNDGDEIYRRAIREAALKLYSHALETVSAARFLDKTPRYYHILPELEKLFPQARFIILVRNPIAVFSSILETNLGGDWQRLFSLQDRRHDIFTAPRLIAKAVDSNSQAVVTRYETIVQSPEQEIRRLCAALDLDFEPGMLQYSNTVSFSDSTFIDPKSIYAHDEPVSDYLESWKNSLDTPEKVHIGRQYIRSLGADLVEQLGYDYYGILAEIDSLDVESRPPFIPWHLLVASEEELSLRDRIKRAFLLSIQNQGLGPTIWHSAKKLFGLR